MQDKINISHAVLVDHGVELATNHGFAARTWYKPSKTNVVQNPFTKLGPVEKDIAAG